MVAVATALALAGCQTLDSISRVIGSPEAGPTGEKHLAGFIGGVVADEPRAAVIGRDVLAAGGTAADAAVAVGFALAVTLPSRASLGAGGACLVYQPSHRGPGHGVPEAILFTSAPGESGGDRPAALPMLARGLYLLHDRYGLRPFETLVQPAEDLARFGVPAPRALVRDLDTVGAPLLADPAAAAVFAPHGTMLTEGAELRQPDLGGTLAQIRTAGVGDLYQGLLAQRLVQASITAGGPMSAAQLRAALPQVAVPLILPAGRRYSAAFLPPPADGGLAAAAAFAVLERSPASVQAADARAMAVAARWRAGSGGNPMALLSTELPAGSLPALPASTSFATLDRTGMAVACSLSMNNLFGTGRIAPGTGILLAASPGDVPLPLLAAGIAWDPEDRAFRAEAAGSGQEGAPLAVAVGLENALRSRSPMPAPVPDPGRVNMIACYRGLPGSSTSCGWVSDPRNAGFAVGGS